MLHHAALVGNVDRARELCVAGAPLEAQMERYILGWKKPTNPLMFGVAFSHLAMTRLLLDQGADVNVIFANRDTPLSVAVELCKETCSSRASLSVVVLLLQWGADPHCQIKQLYNAGWSRRGLYVPLTVYVVRNSLLEMASLLLQNHSFTREELSVMLRETCLELKPGGQRFDHRIEIASMLLDHGADVNTRCVAGSSGAGLTIVGYLTARLRTPQFVSIAHDHEYEGTTLPLVLFLRSRGGVE